VSHSSDLNLPSAAPSVAQASFRAGKDSHCFREAPLGPFAYSLSSLGLVAQLAKCPRGLDSEVPVSLQGLSTGPWGKAAS
jgi:hypothetical protein